MRVVLADDSILLREGIARLLAEAGFEVVGQASTADELVRIVGSDTPNVAVSIEAALAHVGALGLAPEDEAAILGGNAERLLAR